MSNRLSAAVAVLLVSAPPAIAADNPGEAARIARLEAQIQGQDEKIARLEAMLVEQSALLRRLGPSLAPIEPAATSPAIAAAPPPPVVRAASAKFEDARIAGLDVSGDVRLREEYNVSDSDARNRARTVLRARLRATYALSSHFAVGAQIATGDADDPNSTDITLGSFDDDLDATLDQAWIRYTSGGLTLYGGKFPQIFARTDMIWDGDVVPEGIGGTYAINLGRGARIDARAMYFVIDEAQAGPDSYMVGGQLALAFPLSQQWRASLVGGYYGYRLSSLAGADSGDIRSNLFANGRYVSDFRLLEGLGTLTWTGLGERWPVAFTADYVKNLGAAVPSDSGIDLEIAAGRASRKGDWRLSYGYSRVGVDAVFAAFSNDNLALATNYRSHALGLGYMLTDRVMLDGVVYHYRPLDSAYAGTNAPGDWLDRIRLNVSLSF